MFDQRPDRGQLWSFYQDDEKLIAWFNWAETGSMSGEFLGMNEVIFCWCWPGWSWRFGTSWIQCELLCTADSSSEDPVHEAEEVKQKKPSRLSSVKQPFELNLTRVQFAH